MRNFVKVIFFDLLILLLYRIGYYYNHDWFSNPTLQGIILLSAIIIGISFCGVIGFFQPRSGTWRLKLFNLLDTAFLKPGHKRLGGILLALLVLALTTIMVKAGRVPSIITGNYDSITFIFVIILQYMFWDELLAHHQWLDQIIISISNGSINNIIILFISSVIAKLITIYPNAYTLIAPADGYQYWALAQQFFQGSPDFVAHNHYPPLYSLVISPAFLGGVRNSIQNISIINVLLSSSIVFPIFFIARKYLSKPNALFITLAALFYPYHFVYPYYPSSENLYYPLFLWIIFFLVDHPKNPKYLCLWDAFTGVLIGLAYLTRYQTFPLLPAFFLISWLKPELNKPDKITIFPGIDKFKRILPSLLAFILVFSIWLFAGSIQGASLIDLLGFSVEGDGSLLKVTKSVSSTLKWLGLTALYFLLIAAPVLNIFIYSLFSRKKRVPANLIHWLIAISSITLILFITVFRHAWIAYYNYPDPHRLVTRYCIYLAIPFWITGLILLKQVEKIEINKFLFSSLVSIGLVWLGYQVFFNQQWLLLKRIVIFLYIDGHISFFLGWRFIAMLGVSSILLTILTKMNKRQAIAPLIVVTIICMNYFTLPKFINNILNMELPGRMLSEIQDQLINKDSHNSNTSAQYVIHHRIEYVMPEHQVAAKGLDPKWFLFINLRDDNPRIEGKRMVYLTIEVNDEKEYLIIEKRNVKPDEKIISEFKFSKSFYALVEPDPIK